MSIAEMSDAVLKRLVPKVQAGACLPSEPCGTCSQYYGPYCVGGRYALVSYYTKKTDCYGRCTLSAKITCSVRYTGCCC